MFLFSSVSVSASVYSSTLRLTLHTHTQTRGLFKATLVYNTREMQLRWGSVRFARLYAKFYFTFWKRGEKVGNNPINILRLPDLRVHLLAVLAVVSLAVVHVTGPGEQRFCSKLESKTTKLHYHICKKNTLASFSKSMEL